MTKGNFDYTRLRRLLRLNRLIYDVVAWETGISVGYLNRIARGNILEVKNSKKRNCLRDYITKLEKDTLKKHKVKSLEDIE